MIHRARIGGYHATASKLSNHKLRFLNLKNIQAFLVLALHGARGINTAILLFFLPHLTNAPNTYPTYYSPNPSYPSSSNNQNKKKETISSEYISLQCLGLIILYFLMCSMDVHLNPGPIVTNNSENMSIIHNNIKSVKKKLDDLKVEAAHYDIVTLSETLLTKDIKNDDILIENFCPPFRRERQDNTRRWLGRRSYLC